MKSHTARRLVYVIVIAIFGCGKGKGSDKPASGPPKLAITPVGKANGSAVQKLISSAGDTMSSTDGRLTIEIPSGALAAPETLSIQTISNEAPGGIGTAYRLGPEGSTFAAPLKLTFIYSASDLRGTVASALKVAYQGKGGGWNAIKKLTRNESTKLLSVETTHFSDWSLVQGYQLRPPSARLKTNESIQLTVSACGEETTDDEITALTHRLYECRPDPGLIVAGEWTVNAIENGNSTVGTISSGTADDALYTAPSTAPTTGNPVAVSATLIDLASRKKSLLSSTVSIELKPALSGTITSTQVDADGLTITTTAQVVFAWDETAQTYVIQPPSDLDAHLDIVNGPCAAHAEGKAPIATMDGHIIMTEVGYYGGGATAVTLVGTKSCNPNTTEPYSESRNIKWWPTGILVLPRPVKPDGSVEDQMTSSVNQETGTKTDASWSLVPRAQVSSPTP